MNIARIIEKEVNKSGDRVNMHPIPEDRKPAETSIIELDEMIAAQVRVNEAMYSKSMMGSSRTYRS